MEKEEWKKVVGFEGYEVSNLGRVKSLKRNKEKFLKLHLNRGGYLMTALCDNSICKTKLIHQLVAEAFLNHNVCGHKIIVDHINNNPLDNKVENLQLISQRQNASKDVKNKTSKYTGVCWSKANKKWNATIKINRRKKHLGYFINEEEASNVYQNKLKEITQNIIL